ncbi:MAG: DUF4258 domain-containing protein [Methanosphaera sp.]|nr:DUF4258 domain-containing protein [Methanosphaera sp.]
MDVFDRFLIGDTHDIEWCFDNTHFIKRLNQNRISRSFIVDTVFNEEPLRYEVNGNGKYEVFFKAPENKDYKEIKVVFACADNRIDLVTIMPLGSTERQKNRYKSDSYKSLEKKRLQAIRKRR